MKSKSCLAGLCVVLALVQAGYGQGDAPIIVPQPKYMTAGMWDTKLSTPDTPLAAIVVEPQRPKLRIGAEEINRYVEKHGGTKLPVHKLGEEFGDVSTIILLIADVTNPDATTQAAPSVSAADSRVPAPQQDNQAYLIRFAKNGDRTHILLAGYGEQGGLYAAVTFCHMLRNKDGAVRAYRTSVDDWPDFKYRGEVSLRAGIMYAYVMLHRNQEWGRSYMETAEEYIDFGLHLKLNMMNAMLSRFYTYKEHNYLPEITSYARARGFECSRLFPADFEGKKHKVPELKELFHAYLKESGKTTKDFMELRGRYFCWSKDDLLRRFARFYVEEARDDGLTMLKLHFPDTGDENWGHRCDDCRRRFGNDRVAGDANVINILYEELRKVIPRAKFCAVVHPYTAYWLADPAYIEHFTRLSELIPEDVGLCVRETDRAGIELWNKTTRRPAFIYLQPFSLPYRGMIAPFVRTAKTLYFPERKRDLYVVKGWASEFWHIEMPLGAAYAWNTDTPGGVVNTNWANSPFRAWEFDPKGRYDAVVMNVTMPRVAAFTWGDEAGKIATQIYRSGLHPWMIYDPARTENALMRLKGGSPSLEKCLPSITSEVFAFQHQAAEKVRALCMKLMKEEAPLARRMLLPAAVRLYKRAATAAFLAPVLQHLYAAREAVAGGHLDLARQEVEQARTVFATIEDQVAQLRKEVRAFPRVSDTDLSRDFPIHRDKVGALLDKFHVPTLEQLKKGKVSPRILEEVTQRLVLAMPTDMPPVLDGKLDDPCWKGHPHPVKNFVVHPFVGEPRLAADQTIAKICYDGNNLYVAFHLKDANADSLQGKERPHDGSGLMKDDVVEVIVSPAKASLNFAQFIVNPAGSRGDVFKRAGGRERQTFIKDWNPPWTAKASLWRDGWRVEMAIPFSAFIEEPVSMLAGPPKRGDRWRINLAREKRTLELSAIKYMSNSGFRDVGKFAVLLFQ